MAIAFDSASYGSISGTSSSSLTVAHTTAGANRILFVSIAVYPYDYVSGITYGGQDMTLVSSVAVQGNLHHYLYYIVNPTVGNNNIVASFRSNCTYVWMASASYTGASQTGQPDAFDAANIGVTTTITDSITTIADNAWVLMSGFNNNATTWTAGTGSIRAQSGGSVNRLAICDSNSAKTPAGSVTLTMTAGSSSTSTTIIASFSPSGGSSGPANVKTWNGVAKASVKTVNGVAMASIKSYNGVV